MTEIVEVKWMRIVMFTKAVHKLYKSETKIPCYSTGLYMINDRRWVIGTIDVFADRDLGSRRKSNWRTGISSRIRKFSLLDVIRLLYWSGSDIRMFDVYTLSVHLATSSYSTLREIWMEKSFKISILRT